MKSWSGFFQNEEFLEKTRMYVLNPEMSGYVAEKIGLKEGMRVLDVGCGTGAFIWYLARESRNIDFTGLDLDPVFLAAAEKSAPRETRGLRFLFREGDATKMPFPDGSFDAVISHTFFNSCPEYRQALREMLRVCQPGGVIASMTAADLPDVPCSPGIWPKDAACWKTEYDALLEKVQRMYELVAPLKDYLRGIPTAYIPNLFEEEMLQDVSVWPVGRFFSLSSRAIPEEIRRRYIDLSFAADRKRLLSVYAAPEAQGQMTPEEVERFLQLLETRRDWLLAHLEDNRTWEWEGGTSLLVKGRKRTEDERLMQGILSLIK